MHDVAGIIRKPPPRAAYALPTLFTAGNIFLGFLSILRSIEGVAESAHPLLAAAHFMIAAKCIGIAMLLDGVDGRVARMTHTTSEFGKEIDSLSDVISFGIAPAILAYCWGVHFTGFSLLGRVYEQTMAAGKFIAFLFLLCGAARLARFNVQKNPQPKNPGRPNRKYFVGLPIPAAAALVAAVVYVSDGNPVTEFWGTVAWLLLLLTLSLLMVATLRYYAFKDQAFLRPRSPVTIVLAGALIFLIWNWSQPVLLAIASTYAASGVFLRLGGLLRRTGRRAPPQQPVERHLENPVG